MAKKQANAGRGEARKSQAVSESEELKALQAKLVARADKCLDALLELWDKAQVVDEVEVKRLLACARLLRDVKSEIEVGQWKQPTR